MEKTIAAVATGNAAGGLGVIRISGEKAICMADKVFRPLDGSSLSDLKGYRAKFGSIIFDGETFDDAVALVFRAPKSYTGEDVVELSVHGGLFIIEKTLEAIFAAGAVPAEPGEFTKRAFLNGKMDLTQAESVADLISAQGETAAKASYNALQGALSKRINGVLEMLTDSSASMAAWVDYPDEEIPELDDQALADTLESARITLEELLKTYENGQAMIQGIDTAIVGRPNAGKSSLMNLLSGREKSIVTTIEGTTRDVVEEVVRLGELVLHLNDTAGLRESNDEVESIGIERAYQKIESAMLVLPVFDCSRPLNDDDLGLIEKCKNKKTVAIINKNDLPTAADISLITAAFTDCVFISAKNCTDTGELEAVIKKVIGASDFDASAPLLANQRQKLCCQRALEDINEALTCINSGITRDAVNVLIDDAINELLSLTGKKATVEVVNNIFSKFCVGK
ncbi:MAG: tRNA uridine-5-carboxymethylaminomethyl(34) synthesis GTPase MnmE [Eubacterium sp.]|nr:tRNA uridine-5-carboxymethylaminomethyl(34) synthesis GTPase MnmE [Eubacterium sp.]